MVLRIKLVTQEQIIQRRVKFAKQFTAQGASIPQAVKLSGVAEATAQRRGRAYDPLAVVIETAIAPPPPPKIAPPPIDYSKIPTVCRGPRVQPPPRGRTIPRGVSFTGCPDIAGSLGPYAMIPIDYTESRNLTTERYFDTGIRANRKSFIEAGINLGPTQSERSRAKYNIGKAQQVMIKQCGKTAYYQQSSSCQSARKKVTDLKKLYEGF